MEEIIKEIQNLSGSEAKSLLLNTILRLQLIVDSIAQPEEKVQEVVSLYNELVHPLMKEDVCEEIQEEHEAIHLVCGESTAGTLRYSLGAQHNKIIGFPDSFAMGPLTNLHEEAGCSNRHEWLKDHINMEMDYLEDEYNSRFRKAVEQIKRLPENLPIFIWTADNVNEQIGLRYFVFLLQNHPNEIYVINTSLAYQQLMNTKDVLHTGGVTSEKIRTIYETKRLKRLTSNDRKNFEKEWLQLAKIDGVLRIWKENKIETVPVEYYDSQIISTIKKLHMEQEHVDFIKTIKIIGELLGDVAGQIDYTFLEYRIRSLVYDGILKIKGVPKGMRYYSVMLE